MCSSRQCQLPRSDSQPDPTPRPVHDLQAPHHESPSAGLPGTWRPLQAAQDQEGDCDPKGYKRHHYETCERSIGEESVGSGSREGSTEKRAEEEEETLQQEAEGACRPSVLTPDSDHGQDHGWHKCIFQEEETSSEDPSRWNDRKLECELVRLLGDRPSRRVRLRDGFGDSCSEEEPGSSWVDPQDVDRPCSRDSRTRSYDQPDRGGELRDIRCEGDDLFHASPAPQLQHLPEGDEGDASHCTGRGTSQGDALAARFMALHQSLLDQNWTTARHMEIFPMQETSAVGPSLVLATRKHSRAPTRLAGGPEKVVERVSGGTGKVFPILAPTTKGQKARERKEKARPEEKGPGTGTNKTTNGRTARRNQPRRRPEGLLDRAGTSRAW